MRLRLTTSTWNVRGAIALLALSLLVLCLWVREQWREDVLLWADSQGTCWGVCFKSSGVLWVRFDQWPEAISLKWWAADRHRGAISPGPQMMVAGPEYWRGWNAACYYQASVQVLLDESGHVILLTKTDADKKYADSEGYYLPSVRNSAVMPYQGWEVAYWLLGTILGLAGLALLFRPFWHLRRWWRRRCGRGDERGFGVVVDKARGGNNKGDVRRMDSSC